MWDRRADVAGFCEMRDDTLCQACLHRGKSDLAALVLDYVDLEQALVLRGPPGEPVSGTREPPSVLNVTAEAHQRDIWLLTSTWERILREEIGLLAPSARNVRDGWVVQRAARILRIHLVDFSRLPAHRVFPWGVDGDAEEHTGAQAILAMTALHRRVRSFLGLTVLTHHLPGECETCGLGALRRESGSETVFCAGCSATQTWEKYQEYADRIKEGWRQGLQVVTLDLDDFVPAGRAAHLLEVSTAQLRVWRSRGRIEGRRDGYFWSYRLRDLLLLNKHRSKTSAVTSSPHQ
jgi:hypothetical protein